MAEEFIVNSRATLAAAHTRLIDNFDKHKHTVYKVVNCEEGTLPMNSLVHVWLREFAADLARCHIREVTEGMMDGIKRSVKGWFYQETQEPWMIHEVWCPLTGRRKKDYTSRKDWKKGEKLMFMSWLQMFAAQRGTILESKGEYADAVKKQNA
jgi:hypothetical protein